MNPLEERRKGLGWAGAILLAGWASPLWAHTGNETGRAFSNGLWHPVSGIDHLAAMVAVGLWGAQLGKPLIVLLPVAFPAVMAVGGALGIRGVPVPFVEAGVALSALTLGAMVWRAMRPPIWAAVTLVAGFAVFHGYAHGRQVPMAIDPAGFGAGFLIATGLLHLAGIGLGQLSHWQPAGPAIVRILGGAVFVVGVIMSWRALA